MVVRTNVKCHTCNNAITLRVQLSHSVYEEIKFHCPHCKESLSIEVILNQEKITFKINPKQNCSKTTKDGPLLYLSTEIVTSTQLGTDHRILPAAFYVNQIQPDGPIKYFPKETNKQQWELLYRAYNQLKLKNYDLSEKLLKEYCANRKILNEYTYKECLYDHISYTIGEMNIKKLTNIYEIISKQDHQQIIWLRNYIRQRIKAVSPNINVIINEIYEHFDLHYPFIVLIRSGNEDIEDMHYLLSDFNSIKQTYGNIFEVFSELLEILACINNIICHRDYDVFQTMNLDKYKKIDKAKRADPFRDNSNLFIFCNEYDSILRNASHHGHIDYNRITNCVEYYTNNSDNQNSISLKEYLLKINKIFINTITIFCIWLFITQAHD